MRVLALVPGPQLGVLQTGTSGMRSNSEFDCLHHCALQYCPAALPLARAAAAKRVGQILLAVDYLEGLDHPVLKWSLPDNSHVCLASESTEHREHSRDIAVGVGL